MINTSHLDQRPLSEMCALTLPEAVTGHHLHIALAQKNVDVEIDRYIGWPGQALAYKTGEMKILALRAMAQRKLGAKFDLRRFHDALLGGGALPLDLLEDRINTFILTEQSR